jgi:hypothetical protein
MNKTIARFTIALTYVVLFVAVAQPDQHQQTDAVVRSADGTTVGSALTYRAPTRIQPIIRTTDLDPVSVVPVWWRLHDARGQQWTGRQNDRFK